MSLAAVLLLARLAPADLVVEHATLWTNGKLSKNAFVAVRDGRFVAVGARHPDLVGPSTKRFDAKGKVVLPGLIDSHTHLLSGGLSLAELQLEGTSSKSDFLARIEAWAKKTPPGEWIVGSGWSAESWPERTQPTKEWLDPVTGDRPTALRRMDGHSVLLNSAALKLAGIDRTGPPSPSGGSIDRDANGEPTGLLRETAMSLAGRVIPSASAEQTYQGLIAAVRLANSYGITAVSEIASPGSFAQYRKYASDSPTMRFALYPVAVFWTSEIAAAKAFQPIDGWVGVQGVKAYMDGSLGSRTAWMLEPFTKPLPDQTSLTGLPRPGVTDGTYAKGIRAAAEANMQVIVHAIGDRANRTILDLYEAGADNLPSRRFRVEHAQHTSPADIPRFGKLGVIASMQPYHKADDGRYCEEVIGTERSRSSYAYRQLLDGGAKLAFGSDWPVVTLNPFLGIEAAVTGRIQGGKVWMPHQNITVNEALKAYTVDGAYAMRMEKEIGQVAPGFRADFSVLDASPFERNPNWAKMKPVAVWSGGRQVAP